MVIDGQSYHVRRTSCNSLPSYPVFFSSSIQFQFSSYSAFQTTQRAHLSSNKKIQSRYGDKAITHAISLLYSRGLGWGKLSRRSTAQRTWPRARLFKQVFPRLTLVLLRQQRPSQSSSHKVSHRELLDTFQQRSTLSPWSGPRHHHQTEA